MVVFINVLKNVSLRHRCPPHITLDALGINHAEQINNAWPLVSPTTLGNIQRFITLNQNVGAFDANGQLVAWCLRYWVQFVLKRARTKYLVYFVYVDISVGLWLCSRWPKAIRDKDLGRSSAEP